MFERNRLSAITAGLALAVAFSVGGYVLGFGLGEQSGEHQANTDTYARHAQAEINSTCAGLDGVAQTECIVRVVEATNQHERSEGDLKAQRNMARWALLMLLATVAMAVITAFGVYYVWRTLKATQDMANDAKLIGAAQIKSAKEANNVARQAIREGSRPFVYVEPLESNFHIWKEGEAQFSWPFRIENLGGSAAIVESIKVSTRISSTLGENVEWFDHDLMKANGMAPGRTEELVLMPNAQHQPSRGGFLFMLKGENQTDIMNNESFVFMKVFVIYEDMYGDPHETEATFQHAFHTYKVTTAGGKEHNRRT